MGCCSWLASDSVREGQHVVRRSLVSVVAVVEEGEEEAFCINDPVAGV